MTPVYAYIHPCEKGIEGNFKLIAKEPLLCYFLFVFAAGA
ncbi:Hypothetical protein Minf_2465 [Methylacidiphilum infernorum V4]|uniref:Uncharacterized protein n=1 Tax=Methylacidiphilum infernorum (isolate V4) TaxID=481448 RepID=B3E1E2_METI4|nr:Hypothetical protein Minf_2465 [Methylacidiphilum infernorum V4]